MKEYMGISALDAGDEWVGGHGADDELAPDALSKAQDGTAFPTLAPSGRGGAIGGGAWAAPAPAPAAGTARGLSFKDIAGSRATVFPALGKGEAFPVLGAQPQSKGRP